VCGREPEGMTAMLFFFFFECGDAKCCIIRRRLRGPSRAIDVERFSQVLWGSATDDLIAKTSYFVFNAPFYGKPGCCLRRGLASRWGDRVQCWAWIKPWSFLLLYRPARQIASTGVSYTLLEGWGPLYHPAPRIVSTALPHNPLRGMGSFVPSGPFYPQLQGLMMMMMSWCLMSSDVIWHIRDKLWPMPKHGSIKATYVRCMRV